jgi:hypothetical protein
MIRFNSECAYAPGPPSATNKRQCGKWSVNRQGFHKPTFPSSVCHWAGRPQLLCCAAGGEKGQCSDTSPLIPSESPDKSFVRNVMWPSRCVQERARLFKM